MAPIRTESRSATKTASRRSPHPPTGYNHKRQVDGLKLGAKYKKCYEDVHEGPEPYHYPLPLPVPEGIRPVDPRGPLLTLDDLECIKPLGDGANGQVLLVRRRCGQPSAIPKLFALKAIRRKHLRQLEAGILADNISRERLKLTGIAWNPFVVGLMQTFHDDRNVYLMLEYSSSGTLADLLPGPMSPDKMLFYFANIVCGLEHLEKYGIVHRDLKPGNIVVGADGYLSICDFGSAKGIFDEDSGPLAWLGEGTQSYQAPESILLEGQPEDLLHGSAIDWWSSGVILYEMANGRRPFHPPDTRPAAEKRPLPSISRPAADEWHRIVKSPLIWSNTVRVGRKLKALVKGLLRVNANKRLGAEGGVEDIMKQPWLATVDWNKMRQKRYIVSLFVCLLAPVLMSHSRQSLDPLLQA
ncbi:kinase-like domain-containing protein [Mycena polygramma]|nr:kinase-like domain-containing protein [Mycena polygramma]